MIFLKIIGCISVLLSMILTFVCFFGDAIKEMCFFGILSIWFLIDLTHANINDKLNNYG